MLIRAALVSCFLAFCACGEGKVVDEGPDYGDEAGSLKDDSATRPATIETLAVGAKVKTTFSTTKRWRAFLFSGVAGQRIDVLADGLRGLDTVVYVYKVSRTTNRPYGRSFASNDDTESPGWTLGTNRRANPNSASVLGRTLYESRVYAVVATTYKQASTGAAEILVRSSAGPSDDGSGGSSVSNERAAAEFKRWEASLTAYLSDPRFNFRCSTIPGDGPRRCAAMDENYALTRAWRFTVDASAFYAIITSRDNERLFVDLLDGAGRWFTHGRMSLEDDTKVLVWDWSDDNDPTICKCDGSSSAVCRGPGSDDGFYSGSILCD